MTIFSIRITASSVLLSCCLIFSTSLFSQINLDNGLVGYYAFDDNTIDSSSIGITGMATDVITTQGFKNYSNTAYNFNGLTSVVKCDVSNRGITSIVSISAWVRTSVNSNESQVILSKYDWHIDQGFYIGVKEGYPYMAGRNTSGSFLRTDNNTAFVADGNWHHLLGVVGGNTWEIWVDGQLAKTATSNASNPMLTNTQSMNIGNYEEGTSTGDHLYFNGIIDEVRVYNRTLTIDEIAYLSTENLLNGVGGEIENIDVAVYPNPVKNTLSISNENAGEMDIIMMDVTGHLVFQKKSNDSVVNINCLGFAEGVYFVKVGSKKSYIVEKIIVQ